MKRTLIAFCLTLASLVTAVSCGNDPGADEKQVFTITFDTGGGTPTPPSQQVPRGGFVQEPVEEPTLDGRVLIGWYTQLGLRFNFKSTPVTKDIVLVARYWDGPKKYIVINDYDWSFLEKKIAAYFGTGIGHDVLVGQGVLFYLFQRPLENHLDALSRHLKESEENDIPILIQLDPITFWDSVPELWNWWDPSRPGYNPANKENVEWTSWSSDDAVKIGWLNWGTQIRLAPMANLFSPAYQDAVKKRMAAMISKVNDWYTGLPDGKKYLLIGIKITGELAVGVNNWYYTGGNDLVSQSADNDPRSGINMYNKPSRSAGAGAVSTIGYAGCKYAGIRSEGSLTGNDIAMLEKKFTLFVSKIATAYDIPREKIFAHAGGVGNDLDACINDLVCPSWSFYGADASDARNASYCLELFENSNAPRWGVAEWALSGNAEQWTKAIRSALSVNGCHFLSAYCNVIGNNNGTSVNQEAVKGILTICENDTY